MRSAGMILPAHAVFGPIFAQVPVAVENFVQGLGNCFLSGELLNHVTMT